MTIKGQNISNFKLLLSAPPLIDEIPVSVKMLYSYFIPVEHSSPIRDGYYCNNWHRNTIYHNKYFYSLQHSNSNSFQLQSCGRIHSFVFWQVSRIRRNSDWAQIGSGAGSSPRLWAMNTGLLRPRGLAWPVFVIIIDNITTINVTTLPLLSPQTKIHQH